MTVRKRELTMNLTSIRTAHLIPELVDPKPRTLNLFAQSNRTGYGFLEL